MVEIYFSFFVFGIEKNSYLYIYGLCAAESLRYCICIYDCLEFWFSVFCYLFLFSGIHETISGFLTINTTSMYVL